MKKTVILLLVVLFCAAAFARGGGGTVWRPKGGELYEAAVYVTGVLNERERAALEAEMLKALVTCGRFKEAERLSEFMAEIGNAQVAHRNEVGVVDDAYIGQLGKRFGVRYVCVVGVASSADYYYNVSARIIDSESAKVTTFGRSYRQLNDVQTLEALFADVVIEMGLGGYQPYPSLAASVSQPPAAAAAPSIPPSAVSAPPPTSPTPAPAATPAVSAPPPTPPTPAPAATPAVSAPPPTPPTPAPAATPAVSAPPPTPSTPAPAATPAVSAPPPTPSTPAPAASQPPAVATAPSPPPSPAVSQTPPVATAPAPPPSPAVSQTPPAATAPAPPPLPLEDIGASIIIHTMPPDAEVYIGGRLVGKANQPEKLLVPIGEHDVKFVKDDLEKTEFMTFKPGENPTRLVLLDDGKQNKKSKPKSKSKGKAR